MSKKYLLDVAVTTSLLAPLAHAQHFVTLYGLIDAGLMYTNNVKKGTSAGSLVQATSGNTNGSQFGVRGSEDLDSGLSAVFVLESGFNIQNGKMGQNNRFFARQSYVGVDFVAPLSEVASTFGKTGFSHPFDNDNLDYSVRINNAVKFNSPDIDGFKFGGVYAFSNSTDFSANRAYSAGASYGNGPLKLAASYLKINGSNNTNTSGAIETAESTANGTAGFLLGADVQRVSAAGIDYTLGPAVLGFAYSHSQYQHEVVQLGVRHGPLRQLRTERSLCANLR